MITKLLLATVSFFVLSTGSFLFAQSNNLEIIVYRPKTFREALVGYPPDQLHLQSTRKQIV